jgi:putative transposase
MLVRKAFRFRLRPTAEQAGVLAQTVGTVRFLWNSALALQKDRLARQMRVLSFADLCKELTAARNDADLAFLRVVHSKPQQQVLKDLSRALSDFFGGTKGFPRFKRKGRAHDSFRHPERVVVEGKRVQIPGIGWVAFRKSRDIRGKIKNATISRQGKHWFVSLQTEMEVDTPRHPSKSEIGLDMGVATLATLSDGTMYPAQDSYRRLQVKLARAQRAVRRKKKFSANWKKQQQRVARVHQRIANIRRDHQHKVSTTISKNHAMVYVENLKVANMSASAKGTREKPGKNVRAKSGLNKAILDQGWHELRRQLEYKQAWRGGRVVAVPPAYTSQTCAECLYVSDASRAKQAAFECVQCGLQAHADVNAAKNIMRAGQALSACGGTPLGAPVKQEPLAA